MVYLFTILILILLLLSWKYIVRLEPAGIYAAMWIFMGVGVVSLDYYLVLNFYGCSFILFGVILFVIGTIFSDYFYYPTPSIITLKLRTQWVMPLLVALIIGAMVNPIYSIILHGFSLRALLSMQELLNMNEQIAIDRYSGANMTNIVNQFFLIFNYTAPVVGGFCFRLVGRWIRVLCVITIIPGMFIALTQSMKMGMIISFFLWFSSYIISSYCYGKPVRLKTKTFLRLFLIIIGFLLILFLSMVLRTGEVSEKSILEISEKFVSYTLGHMHNIDLWYISHAPSQNSWGSHTFMGISNLLGTDERILGIYHEFNNIGRNGFYGISNTFTIFRPLSEDFGEVGCLLSMFLMGIAANMSLKTMISHRMAVLNQTILIALYSFLMWSFSASLFSYTSIIASYFLNYVLLKILQKETITC